MLSLTCKCGEAVLIYPSEEIDPGMTVAELFAGGPVVVQVYDTSPSMARVAIDAPRELTVLREELTDAPSRS